MGLFDLFWLFIAVVMLQPIIARGMIPDLRRITTCCGASGMTGENIG
jgi:hypothetical protein